MQGPIIEAQYPLDFRFDDAQKLGNLLKNRNSVVLVGMKRIGISNFLRFFLYHQDIAQKYIGEKNHLFIPVDLNDLVEREIFPFWMLTLKRVVDRVQNSSLDAATKKTVETLFLDSIQSNDLFLLIDCVRRSIIKIVEANILPTIFFIRFDRITDSATEQFLNNLEGLITASHYKLTYIFTTFRRLDQLKDEIFNHSSLSFASNTLYIKPAKKTDLEIISQTYLKQYNLKLSDKLKGWLFGLVDGYVQYMQLSLIALSELDKNRLGAIKSQSELLDLLTSDERISLQSEELWDSLTNAEKEVILKINSNKAISKDDQQAAKYVFETGIVIESEAKLSIFSPIFANFLNQINKKISLEDNGGVELSKKENLLFQFLKNNIDQICEREAIIEAVWPEEEALGVSDWAIDRLIARLRAKLKKQKVSYEIVTVKTRGYKLTSI